MPYKDPEYRKKYAAKHKEEIAARMKLYRSTPEYKSLEKKRYKKRCQNPDYKNKKRAKNKIYYEKPEKKLLILEYQKEHNARPEIRERQKKEIK